MAAAFKRFAGKTLSGPLACRADDRPGCWRHRRLRALGRCRFAEPAVAPGCERGLGCQASRLRCRARCSGSTPAETRPRPVLAASYAHLPSPAQLPPCRPRCPRAGMRASSSGFRTHSPQAVRRPAEGRSMPTRLPPLVASPPSSLADAPGPAGRTASTRCRPPLSPRRQALPRQTAGGRPSRRSRPKAKTPCCAEGARSAGGRAARPADRVRCDAAGARLCRRYADGLGDRHPGFAGDALRRRGAPTWCKLTGSALEASLGRGLHARGASAGNARYKGRRDRDLLRRRARRPDDLVRLCPGPTPWSGSATGSRRARPRRRPSPFEPHSRRLHAFRAERAGPSVSAACTNRGQPGRKRRLRARSTRAAPCSRCWSLTDDRARRPWRSPRLRPRARSWVALSISVSATASSGLPVDLSVDAASAGVCAITGNLVTFSGEGTCTISAEQAGGHGFLAAPKASQSFLVARSPQAVSFLSTPACLGGGRADDLPRRCVVLRKPAGHAVRRAVERCRLRDLWRDRHRDRCGNLRDRSGSARRHRRTSPRPKPCRPSRSAARHRR